MNLQQLRYAVATAEAGSMTAAARAVHVAQPALSRGVRNLERELGVELFAIHGRSVQLTSAGATLIDAIRRVLHEVDMLSALAGSLRDAESLTISSTPSLEQAYTSPAVARFVVSYPDTSISMTRASGRNEVLELVRDGEVELGVVDFDELPTDMCTWPLDRDEVVIVAPPRTELPDVVEVQLLHHLPLIVPRRGTSRRTELDDLFVAHGITPRVAIESDERTTWVQSMLRGIGSFLAYRSTANRLAEQGAVVRPFLPSLSRTIALVHRDGDCSAAAQAFVAVALAGTAS